MSTITPRLLDAADAADYLGVSKTTFLTLRFPVLKIGRCVRFDVRDLDAYIEKLRGAA